MCHSINGWPRASATSCASTVLPVPGSPLTNNGRCSVTDALTATSRSRVAMYRSVLLKPATVGAPCSFGMDCVAIAGSPQGCSASGGNSIVNHQRPALSRCARRFTPHRDAIPRPTGHFQLHRGADGAEHAAVSDHQHRGRLFHRPVQPKDRATAERIKAFRAFWSRVAGDPRVEPFRQRFALMDAPTDLPQVWLDRHLQAQNLANDFGGDAGA